MPRLLLIEDDEPLRRALRLVLEKSGYFVVETPDGGEGLKQHRANAFDLVITDIIMPEVEGVETIRGLRNLSPTVPIIAISGGGRNSSKDYLELAARFGANHVLAKPFKMEALVDAVSNLLKTKSN